MQAAAAPRNAPPRAHAASAAPPRRTRAPSPARGAARLPDKPSPQLATPVTRPPEGAGLAVRAEARRLSRAVPRRGRRRRGADAPRQRLDASDFEAIADAARALPCRAALIDGEAVVYDSRGVTSFQRLQNALKGDRLADRARRFRSAASRRLGSDARAARRAQSAARAVARGRAAGDPLRRARRPKTARSSSPRPASSGSRASSRSAPPIPTAQERTRSWLKIKCLKREEFVVVGLHRPRRLAHGVRRAARRDARRARAAPLRYAGKVGTGFDERTLEVAARAAAAARAPHAARRARVGARRRRAACTGSSRSSSPRSPTPNGPATAACGTRSSSACARTSRPRGRRGARDAAARTPAKPLTARSARRQAPRAPHASRQGAVPRTRHHETAARRLLARRSPTSRCRCCAAGR